MLARNADIVAVSPYGVTINAGNAGGSGTSRYQYLNYGTINRVRQSGYAVKVKMRIGNMTGITNRVVQFWRPNPPGGFSYLGASQNLVGIVSPNSVNTVTLSTPVLLQDSDLAGELIEGTLPSAFLYTQSKTGSSIYRRIDQVAVAETHNFTFDTSVASTIVPIEVQMQAPDIVAIGDSIVEGWPYAISPADTVNTGPTYNGGAGLPLHHSLRKIIYERTGYSASIQNVAIGGQATTAIEARFSADLVAGAPRMAIINGGNNDINTSVPESTFLAKWTSVLNMCAAASVPIIPIVLLMPSNNGWTNGQMQTRDTWNADLRALCAASYPTAIVVDPNPYVSQFRAGGDAGNLWDQKPELSAGDGAAHFNYLGYYQIARAIADRILQPASRRTA